jgi:hypothetical protein
LSTSILTRATVLSLSGTDGCGKSTFATALQREFARRDPELSVTRLWLRWNPKPDTSPNGAQSNNPVSTVDVRYRGHPLKRALVHAKLSGVWREIATNKYRHQLTLQLGSVIAGSLLIADRFTLDFFADMIAANVLSLEDLPAAYEKLPIPDLPYILTVSDEVLISRRMPTEDPGRLIERSRLYLRMARLLQIPILDTTDVGAVDRVLEDWAKINV